MKLTTLPKPSIGAISLAMLLLPASVLIAHAGLWPQGIWKGDEYFGLASWRLWGFAGEWYRLVHWGPRPFSEALLYLYWCAVRIAHRPLLAPALGSAWAILLIFLAAALQPWRAPGRIARCTILAVLPALFLLSAEVEDLYYHPYSSLAYLPALGATGFVVILLAGPGLGDRRGWVAAAIALVIGATSVEHGAFFAAAMLPFLCVIAARAPRSGRLLRAACICAVIAAVAVVLVLFWTGRITTAQEIFGNRAIDHRALLDARLAVVELIREVLRPPGWSIGASLLVKGLVFFCMRHCLAAAWPVRPSRLALTALLVGLGATVFLSVFGAYYNFGELCCQRMASYRQAVFLLALVAGAGFFRPARPLHAAAPLLTLAVLINLQPRLLAIGAEYRLAGARAAARHITFASGMAPGPAPLDYVVPPPGPLFNYDSCSLGTHEMSRHVEWSCMGPLLFFGKQQMQARALPFRRSS